MKLRSLHGAASMQFGEFGSTLDHQRQIAISIFAYGKQIYAAFALVKFPIFVYARELQRHRGTEKIGNNQGWCCPFLSVSLGSSIVHEDMYAEIGNPPHE
jgi:hypothetical protein